MTTEVVHLAPQPGPQEVLLGTDVSVAIYGGAAGGGKTYALVLDACVRAYEDERFSGILFRRTAPELKQAGGPWTAVREIAPLLGATLNESSLTAKWPSGATLACRHMQHDHDKHRYQGGAYTWVGFDEAGHFSWGQVGYMLSRMRSAAGAPVVMRMTLNPTLLWRSAVEPWLTADHTLPPDADLPLGWITFREGIPQSVIGSERPGPGWQRLRVIPAKLEDNALLVANDPGYADRIESMTAVERARLGAGRWDATDGGHVFAQADWRVVEPRDVPRGLIWYRSWDLAATAPHPANPDPDYTRGVLLATEEQGDGLATWIRDGVGGQLGPSDRDELIVRTAHRDGRGVQVVIEVEPGSGGKSQAEYLARRLRREVGCRVHLDRPTGSKEARLQPVVAMAERSCVHLVGGDYADSMLAEARVYPDGKRDWWDAVSQGVGLAAPRRRATGTSRRQRPARQRSAQQKRGPTPPKRM